MSARNVPEHRISVRSTLQAMLSAADPLAERTAHSFAGFTGSSLQTLREQGFTLYEGKVRQCLSRGNQLHLVHTDRLSAFDRAITLVPYKGVALNQINQFWLKNISRELPTAYIAGDRERLLVMKKLEPIKAEVIVRGYLAGSMLRAYERGERSFCGVTLSDGLVPYGPLPRPILTPTSKAEVYEHDENRTPAELIEEGVCSAEEWQEINDLALALFAMGQSVYQQKGWILVDTKYEFGRDAYGRIFLIDEVHTPDSSRLWKADSYRERCAEGLAPEMLDKELIRRYLIQHGFQGKGPVPTIPLSQVIELGLVYCDVAEHLIGEELLVKGPNPAAVSDLLQFA